MGSGDFTADAIILKPANSGLGPIAVADTFTRSGSGWGDAETGGTWSLGSSASLTASTDGSTGVLVSSGLSTGQGAAITASVGSSGIGDKEYLFRFKCSAAMAASNGHFVAVNLRRVDRGGGLYARYYAELHIGGTGGNGYNFVSIQYTNGISGSGQNYYSTDPWSIDEWVWCRVRIEGRSPTTIKFKTWVDGDTEPDWLGTYQHTYAYVDDPEAARPDLSVAWESVLQTFYPNQTFNYDDFLVRSWDGDVPAFTADAEIIVGGIFTADACLSWEGAGSFTTDAEIGIPRLTADAVIRGGLTDEFDRVESSGWGTGPLGTWVASTAPTSVDGEYGIIGPSATYSAGWAYVSPLPIQMEGAPIFHWTTRFKWSPIPDTKYGHFAIYVFDEEWYRAIYVEVLVALNNTTYGNLYRIEASWWDEVDWVHDYQTLDLGDFVPEGEYYLKVAWYRAAGQLYYKYWPVGEAEPVSWWDTLLEIGFTEPYSGYSWATEIDGWTLGGIPSPGWKVDWLNLYTPGYAVGAGSFTANAVFSLPLIFEDKFDRIVASGPGGRYIETILGTLSATKTTYVDGFAFHLDLTLPPGGTYSWAQTNLSYIPTLNVYHAGRVEFDFWIPSKPEWVGSYIVYYFEFGGLKGDLAPLWLWIQDYRDWIDNEFVSHRLLVESGNGEAAIDGIASNVWWRVAWEWDADPANAVRAKVWQRGYPEPEDWLFEDTRSTTPKSAAQNNENTQFFLETDAYNATPLPVAVDNLRIYGSQVDPPWWLGWGTLTFNAVLKRTHWTFDAVIAQGYFWANAIKVKTRSTVACYFLAVIAYRRFTVDALLVLPPQVDFTIDAVLIAAEEPNLGRHDRGDYVHSGVDLDTIITLARDIGTHPYGEDLHTFLGGLHEAIRKFETTSRIWGLINANAVLFGSGSGSTLADAELVPMHFYADSCFAAFASGTFDIDSVMLILRSGSVAADAFVQPYFWADAWIYSAGSGYYAADALVLRTQNGSLTVDAATLETLAGSLSVDAATLAEMASTFTADAAMVVLRGGSLVADAIAIKTLQDALAADSAILAITESALTAAASLDPIWDDWSEIWSNPVAATGGTFDADAILRAIISGSLTADAIVLLTGTDSATADAIIKVTISGSLDADALITALGTGSFTADAFVQPYFTADAVIVLSAVPTTALQWRALDGTIESDNVLPNDQMTKLYKYERYR